MLRYLLVAAFLASTAHAQSRPDTLAVAVDTLGVIGPGEAGPPLDLGVPIAAAAEGGLDAPVTYAARDSLRIRIADRDSLADGDPADDVVSLYGEARATYQEATITSGVLRYLSGRELLQALPLDVGGEALGVPQFTDGQETFSGQRFEYNLASQRGRVTGARTQIDDGFLLGGIVKQADAHVIYAKNAAYTTCDLDHPHYSLEAGRIKVVDGERVYSGPVQLKLLGIPMPVILPFGYFPAAEGRRSGPLAVRYGRESGFGLLLENVGWYWAISDYLDAQVAAKVGTEGSVRLTGATNYNRRYAYNGRLQLEVGRLRTGESTDPTFSVQTPIGVRWSHNQTLPAGERVTASVNLQTASKRFISDDLESQVTTSTNSTVGYAQSWQRVGRSLNVSLQAFQNFATNQTTLTLPSLSFTQQRRFPFRRGRDDRWFEKISVEYSNRATNTFQYTPLDSAAVSLFDALTSPAAFRNATCDPEDLGCDPQRFDYDVVQTVPVQASFSVPRVNLSLTPSLTFTETWTGESIRQTYVDSLARPLAFQDPGFTAVRRLQTQLSASTEFFGTFPLRFSNVDGLRHTVRPRVSLSFEPDYSAVGFVREVQADSTGRTSRYAIHPSIPTDPQRTLSVSIDNAFLARTVRTDSTGEETRSANQVLSVGITGGYNFAATERPFRDVGVQFASPAFGLSASGSARYSAYAADSTGRVTGETYYGVSGRPLRLTNVSLRIGRTFSAGSAQRGPGDVRAVVAPPRNADYDPEGYALPSAVVGYVDYAAPFSIALDLSLNYDPDNPRRRTTATLRATRFNTRLTPNWSLEGTTGLDLTTFEITSTRLGLRRDLHCWEMSIDWQPIGPVKGFGVSLYVKSGYLRDFLRIDAPRSTVRSPLSGVGRPF